MIELQYNGDNFVFNPSGLKGWEVTINGDKSIELDAFGRFVWEELTYKLNTVSLDNDQVEYQLWKWSPNVVATKTVHKSLEVIPPNVLNIFKGYGAIYYRTFNKGSLFFYTKDYKTIGYYDNSGFHVYTGKLEKTYNLDVIPLP